MIASGRGLSTIGGWRQSGVARDADRIRERDGPGVRKHRRERPHDVEQLGDAVFAEGPYRSLGHAVGVGFDRGVRVDADARDGTIVVEPTPFRQAVGAPRPSPRRPNRGTGRSSSDRRRSPRAAARALRTDRHRRRTAWRCDRRRDAHATTCNRARARRAVRAATRGRGSRRTADARTDRSRRSPAGRAGPRARSAGLPCRSNARVRDPRRARGPRSPVPGSQCPRPRGSRGRRSRDGIRRRSRPRPPDRPRRAAPPCPRSSRAKSRAARCPRTPRAPPREVRDRVVRLDALPERPGRIGGHAPMVPRRDHRGSTSTRSAGPGGDAVGDLRHTGFEHGDDARRSWCGRRPRSARRRAARSRRP